MQPTGRLRCVLSLLERMPPDAGIAIRQDTPLEAEFFDRWYSQAIRSQAALIKMAVWMLKSHFDGPLN